METTDYWILIEEGSYEFRVENRSSGKEYRYSKASFTPFIDNSFVYNQTSKTFEPDLQNGSRYILENGVWVIDNQDDALLKGADETARTVTYTDSSKTIEFTLTLNTVTDISNQNEVFDGGGESLTVLMGAGAKKYDISYIMTTNNPRYELNEKATAHDTGNSFLSLDEFITYHTISAFTCANNNQTNEKCVKFDSFVAGQTSGDLYEWIYDNQHIPIGSPTLAGTWWIEPVQGVTILFVDLISPDYDHGDGWEEMWSVFGGDVWRGNYSAGGTETGQLNGYNKAVIDYIETFLNIAPEDFFINPYDLSSEYIWLNDMDPQMGEISGNLEIRKAFNEAPVLEYNLYWGIDPVTKYSTVPIATFPTTGTDHNYTFPNNTAIPAGVNHLIVLSKTASGELFEGTSMQIPDMRDIRLTTEGAALIAAGFIYIPGGFDVDDDYMDEKGFWIAKYEAKDVATPVANLAVTPRQILQGGQLYSPISTRFDDRLCGDVSNDHTTTFDSIGACRGNTYSDNVLSLIGFTSFNQVQFMASLTPVVNYSWIEARHALASTPAPVTGTSLDLPTEVQWLQLMQHIVNHPQNWIGNNVGGTLYQGHSDSAPATLLDATTDDNNGYWGTLDASGSAQRRTFYISNWRDLNVPPDYNVVIWDLAGNVDEYTRGLISARMETSIDGATTAGDRFASASGVMDWDTLQTFNLVPFWWLPEVNNDQQQFPLTNTAHGVGSYNDGWLSSGAFFGPFDIGYTNTFNEEGVSVITRGGRNDASSDAGINNVSLEHGPGFKAPQTGFRAVVVIPDTVNF